MILVRVRKHIILPIFKAKVFAKHYYLNSNNACPMLNTVSGICYDSFAL